MEKHKKDHTTIIDLKYQLQHGMINLIYLTDHNLSNIQDHFEYIKKKHTENIDNPLVRIYVNKIENRTILEALKIR